MFPFVHRIVRHVYKFVTLLNYFFKNEVIVVCFVVKADEEIISCKSVSNEIDLVFVIVLRVH